MLLEHRDTFIKVPTHVLEQNWTKTVLWRVAASQLCLFKCSDFDSVVMVASPSLLLTVVDAAVAADTMDEFKDDMKAKTTRKNNKKL